MKPKSLSHYYAGFSFRVAWRKLPHQSHTAFFPLPLSLSSTSVWAIFNAPPGLNVNGMFCISPPHISVPVCFRTTQSISPASPCLFMILTFLSLCALSAREDANWAMPYSPANLFPRARFLLPARGQTQEPTRVLYDVLYQSKEKRIAVLRPYSWTLHQQRILFDSTSQWSVPSRLFFILPLPFFHSYIFTLDCSPFHVRGRHLFIHTFSYKPSALENRDQISSVTERPREPILTLEPVPRFMGRV